MENVRRRFRLLVVKKRLKTELNSLSNFLEETTQDILFIRSIYILQKVLTSHLLFCYLGK